MLKGCGLGKTVPAISVDFIQPLAYGVKEGGRVESDEPLWGKTKTGSQ
jgi:hypothetical protein